MSTRYTKEFRVRVAKEAALPEFEGMEHIIAEKYGIKPWTVAKWRDIYLEFGEEGKRSQKKKSPREMELEKENAELKEEIEILKKAAAFLADLRRE